MNSSRAVTATIWGEKGGDATDSGLMGNGQILNWSENGLCIEVSDPLKFNVGARLFVQLQLPDAGECPLLQGVIKHCTPDEKGTWRVGVGNVGGMRLDGTIGALVRRVQQDLPLSHSRPH